MVIGLNKPFFVMAPMDDVTDTVFRQIVSSCSPPDICFSEFVNVDGLMSQGRQRIIHKLEREQSEPPLIAHIWGIRPDNFYAIADQIASGELAHELGMKQNFAGIDLNMGCPVKQVVKTGACSALINNHELAEEIIAATKKGAAGRLPVSVKTRIGYTRIEPGWTEFLLNQGLDMLTVHLRTTREMSLVPAHYEELDRIHQQKEKIAPKTLLVANGDIETRQQGLDIAKKYFVDGIMIGRGVFHDPFVFSPDSPWEGFTKSQKIELFKRHLKLYKEWSDRPDKAVGRMNKYAKIYINGFDGAKEYREQIALSKTIDQMLNVLESGSVYLKQSL